MYAHKIKIKKILEQILSLTFYNGSRKNETVDIYKQLLC